MLGSIHYSLILVASQDPTTLSAGSVTNVNNFIKSLNDQVSGYKATIGVQGAARLFGWDGGKNYTLGDDTIFDQSNATCHWA